MNWLQRFSQGGRWLFKKPTILLDRDGSLKVYHNGQYRTFGFFNPKDEDSMPIMRYIIKKANIKEGK